MVIEFDSDKTQPLTIKRFMEIFESSVAVDRARHPKELDDSYRSYRAFNNTMWSGKLNSMVLSYQDSRELAIFLLESDQYGNQFVEWISVRELDWELKTLPRNAYNIYTIGRREFKRRQKRG